jgi:DNA polymerase III epsilon subunit-like protein
MRIVFLDTETTSLDIETGEVWEVGCIVRDTDRSWDEAEYEKEMRWFLPLFNFKNADPFALDIGKFWERYVWPDPQQYTKDYMGEWARMFMQMTKGAYIVGAIPSFDIERLNNLCMRYDYRLFNHYHLVDVEALAAGKLGLAPPWKSDDVFQALGIDTNSDEYTHGKHTALGDARVVRDVYDSVMKK